MIKFLFVGRRAAGTTRRGALDHLRDTHAKMVVCPPPDAGAMPLDYVQNHVIDGAYPGDGIHALERDLVTEFWFESVEHLRSATATPYYLANLHPDEPRFVDQATVAKMMVRPQMLTSQDPPDGAVYKAFLLISRNPDAGDTAWETGRTATASAFCNMSGAIAAVENVVLPPPIGGAPFVDIVFEGWYATSEKAMAVVSALGERIADFGADTVAMQRSFAVAAEQYDTPRLRALHGCLPLP